METAFAGLRSDTGLLSLSQALNAPVDVLLGVTTAAREALEPLHIRTVYDLGASSLFATARRIATAAGPDGVSGRHGLVAGDWLDSSPIEQPPDRAAALGARPIAAMRLLTAAQAASLTDALGIATIADLAHWPPHLAARALVGEQLGNDAGAVAEDLAAEALRPRMGEHPTESVHYTTLLLFDTLDKSGEDELAALETSGPIGIAGAVDDAGFKATAVGAWVTFKQSWYSRGVTLGRLLHSLALAPGEATRIAIVDWARRSSASATESISEQESLSASVSRSQASEEIQNAVATDTQSGFSNAFSAAQSKSGSIQGSAGTGLLSSLFVSADVSGGYQAASSQSYAQSLSYSQGRRDINASMSHWVNDSTQQHANSARSRRASAIREVSQAEHQQASTRIVANYNHMHALTIQYFEVIQVYAVETAIRSVERALFVPVGLIDFKDDAVRDRFRGSLLGAALNRRAAQLLADEVASVALDSPTPSADIARIVGVSTRVGDLAKPRTPSPDVLKAVTSLNAALGLAGADAGKQASASEFAASVATQSVSLTMKRAHEISSLVGRPLFRAGSTAQHYAADTVLVSVWAEGFTLRSVKLDRPGNGDDSQHNVSAELNRINFEEPPRLVDLVGILIAKTGTAPAQGRLHLRLSLNGVDFDALPIPVALGEGTALHRAVTFRSDRESRRKELVEHLQANRLHYSQAIYRGLDPAMVALLLSPYSLGGVPLARLVDPVPLGITGNWLVLKAPAGPDDDSFLLNEGGRPLAWKALLEQQGLLDRKPDARVIPVPTGGVFAEAVLGRSNGAEKLDITRFWNWQDSPPPLVPPEISPVAVDSRRDTENLMPGQLGAPVVNMVNPPALPDPTGVGAVLNTLAQGQMFRDMSGTAGTQAMAQAGQQGAVAAATDAAQIMSANMRTQAQKAVAMGQIAADIVKSVVGMGGGSGASQTVSAEGARIAHGQDMDRRGVPAGGASGPGPATGATGSSARGGPGSTGTIQQPGVGAQATAPASNESVAVRQAQFGILGEPSGAIARMAVARLDDGAQDAGAPAGAPPPDPLLAETGGFHGFVAAKRVDPDVARTLHQMHQWTQSSWTWRYAHFAHSELIHGPNLAGIVRTSRPDQVSAAKALVPASEHANVDESVTRLNLPGTRTAGETITWEQAGWQRALIVLSDLAFDKSRAELSAVVTHELAHMRNRVVFDRLDNAPPTSFADCFVDAALAQSIQIANAAAGKPLPSQTASLHMTEFVARVVERLVHLEIARGARVSDEIDWPDRLAAFLALLRISETGGYRDQSGYFDALGPDKAREQVALWIRRAGERGLGDYDPAWTERLRNYMVSIHEAARNQVNPDGSPAPFRRPDPRD